MNAALDLIAAWHESPREAARMVMQERALGPALLILFMTIIGIHTGGLLLLSPSAHSASVVLVAGGAARWIGAMIALAILSATVHFFAELLGGAGRATDLFAWFCLASQPFMLLLPVGLIARAMPVGGTIFFAGVTFAITIRTVWLQWRGVEELYALPPGRARAAWALPFIAGGGLAGVTVLLGLIALLAFAAA